jgi:hypothetical protein
LCFGLYQGKACISWPKPTATIHTRETNNNNFGANIRYVKANYRNLGASTTGRLTTVIRAPTAVFGRPITVTWKARIFKLLRSPKIDSKESTLSAYVL